MNVLLAQYINGIEKFVVVLNMEGQILLTNKKWMAYCQENEVPEALWRIHRNYLGWLKEAGRSLEFESIRQVLDGIIEDYPLLIPWETCGETHWFLLEVKPVWIANGTSGAILFKQKVKLHPEGDRITD